jgi:CRISPR-associated protein Csm3
MSSEDRLKGVLEIEMIMECLTGLRIGAGPEALEIGGAENLIIKDPLTRLPYVPGSSLKGAMRARYELFSTRPINHEVVKEPQKIRMHMCEDPDCEICRVFGRTPEKLESREAGGAQDNMIYTTRLKIDDAYPTEETIGRWRDFSPEGVEVKWENVLDRLTSRANPRAVERVPRGSEFKITMSYKIFDQKDVDNVAVIFQSLKLVEDDYLGGYGSRGYGRVRFKNITMRLKKREYYEKCDDGAKIAIKRDDKKEQYSSLEELLKDMEKIIEEIKTRLSQPRQT